MLNYSWVPFDLIKFKSMKSHKTTYYGRHVMNLYANLMEAKWRMGIYQNHVSVTKNIMIWYGTLGTCEDENYVQKIYYCANKTSQFD